MYHVLGEGSEGRAKGRRGKKKNGVSDGNFQKKTVFFRSVSNFPFIDQETTKERTCNCPPSNFTNRLPFQNVSRTSRKNGKRKSVRRKRQWITWSLLRKKCRSRRSQFFVQILFWRQLLKLPRWKVEEKGGKREKRERESDCQRGSRQGSLRPSSSSLRVSLFPFFQPPLGPLLKQKSLKLLLFCNTIPNL